MFKNKEYKGGKNKTKEKGKEKEKENDVETEKKEKEKENEKEKKDGGIKMSDKEKNENCRFQVVLNIISESAANTPYSDIVSFSFDWDRVVGAYYDVNMGIVYFAFQGKGMSFEYSARYLQSRYYSSDYGTRAGRNIFAFNCIKRVLDEDFALAYRACLIDSLKSTFNNDAENITNFDSSHVLKEQGWCFFADISHKCLFYVAQRYTMRISLKMFDQFKLWSEKQQQIQEEKAKVANKNKNENSNENDKNSSKGNKNKTGKSKNANKKVKNPKNGLSRWKQWLKITKRENEKNESKDESKDDSKNDNDNDKNKKDDTVVKEKEKQDSSQADKNKNGKNGNGKEKNGKAKKNDLGSNPRTNMIKILSTPAMLPGLGNSLTKCTFLYNQTTFVSLCKIGVSGKVPYMLRAYTESLHQFAKHD